MCYICKVILIRGEEYMFKIFKKLFGIEVSKNNTSTIEKVLKVRVRHFKEDKYTVEYSYTTGYDSYSTIQHWISSRSDGFMNPVLLPYKEAEQFAKKFKTIEDIFKYQHQQDVLRESWQKENIPYKTKQIIG